MPTRTPGPARDGRGAAPPLNAMDPSFHGGRLTLVGLTKRYPGLAAVHDLQLEVKSGEFLTLLGPSGSGKTTTLMMIAGFTPPSEGEILVDGQPITAMPPDRRNIGVVFQHYALFPHMTVFENVAFPLRMRRVPKPEIRSRVAEALAMVRLSGLEGRMPRQLSGGQQQRVALARALVFRPGLLLMDEPLGALDKHLREQMQLEIKRLHQSLRITVLYVTHDQGEALTMSDRIALMNRGRIEQLGEAPELYDRPVNRFVAEFLGESNLLPGRFEPDPAGRTGAVVTAAGLRLPVAVTPLDATPHRTLLVLRPEKLVLRPDEGPPTRGCRGVVTDVTYVGDFTRYRVRLAEEVIVTAKLANRGGTFRAAPGARVVVDWDPGDARLLPGEAESLSSTHTEERHG